MNRQQAQSVVNAAWISCCGGRTRFHKRRLAEHCTTTVSYYSVLSLNFGVCFQHFGSNSNNIDNYARHTKKKKKETLQNWSNCNFLDVCLFADLPLPFRRHTFHLTHFRNTSLAFSELLPSLRERYFPIGRTNQEKCPFLIHWIKNSLCNRILGNQIFLLPPQTLGMMTKCTIST